MIGWRCGDRPIEDTVQIETDPEFVHGHKCKIAAILRIGQHLTAFTKLEIDDHFVPFQIGE